MALVDCPLARTAQLGLTDYWNDSCALEELSYAIERGATGATSNPSIVLEVMSKEKSVWVPFVREAAAAHPTWSEVELTWATIEAMAAGCPCSSASTDARVGCRFRSTRPTIAIPSEWWSRPFGSTA
jgi:hypothetical protein